MILFSKGEHLKTDTTFYPVGYNNVNFYLVYSLWVFPNSSTALENSLCGLVSFTKNGETDPNKFKYTGCGISFSSKPCLRSRGQTAHDLIIIGANLIDSKYSENKKK